MPPSPLEKICSLAPDYLHYKLRLSQSLGLLARKLAMHLNAPHEWWCEQYYIIFHKYSHSITNIYTVMFFTEGIITITRKTHLYIFRLITCFCYVLMISLKVRKSHENIRISHDIIRNYVNNLMRKLENLMFSWDFLTFIRT